MRDRNTKRHLLHFQEELPLENKYHSFLPGNTYFKHHQNDFSLTVNLCNSLSFTLDITNVIIHPRINCKNIPKFCLVSLTFIEDKCSICTYNIQTYKKEISLAKSSSARRTKISWFSNKQTFSLAGFP